MTLRKPARWLARLAASAFRRGTTIVRLLTRMRSYGVHAVPFTPEGRVVLVWLTYAHGWRCPGGGRRESEAPDAAVLRELREEIGLVAHGPLRLIGAGEGQQELRRDASHFFLVTDVRYRPRRSLETERVAEFDPRALPPETSPLTRRQVALAVETPGAPPPVPH